MSAPEQPQAARPQETPAGRDEQPQTARPGQTPAARGEQARTARAGQTRAVIVEAALRLFRENGYEATTMRAIAREAGVATGNAYYYFGSKEELIQEFYARNHAEHAAACRPVLDAETELAPRLRGVLRALIDVQAPYHSFAAKMYKHAAEPANPLSPFSNESSPTRSATIALYAEVLEGAHGRVPADLRERLPELLWLYSMGIVLYWVHDSSPGCAKTYRLIDSTVPLAERLIRLSRYRALNSVTRQILAIIDDLRS
jgi:AcrR family transcriptional regulator